MPRYFFDISDNGEVAPDKDGTELASLEEARQQALATLAQIAKDELPDGDKREFVIDIRDGGGGTVPLLSAKLAVSVKRADS